jgi:hypothetical protein
MPDRKPVHDTPAPSSPDILPGERHVADEPVADPDAADAAVRSPVTETGAPVEEQIRKQWDPNKNGGLPTPLGAGDR